MKLAIGAMGVTWLVAALRYPVQLAGYEKNIQDYSRSFKRRWISDIVASTDRRRRFALKKYLIANRFRGPMGVNPQSGDPNGKFP